MRLQIFLLCLIFSSVVWAQDVSPSSPNESAHNSATLGTPAALGAPMSWVSPKYPKDVLKNKIQGSVVLFLTVDANGNVGNTQVASGDAELATAAVKAIRRWKYAPYFVNGKARKVITKVTINFKINPAGQPDLSASYEALSQPVDDQVFKVGNGVAAPRALFAPDPEYSEEARIHAQEGVCLLSAIVASDGRPYDIRVTKSVRYGLDEKAVEAVRQWRFVPGTKDGKPVAVTVQVQVSFRLRQ